MDIFEQKVNHEITRAAEYLESNVSKHPEGYRVQIESLQDSVSLIHIAAATKKFQNNEFKKVLADAQSMLEKLKFGLVRAECITKSAASTSSTNSSDIESTMQRCLFEIPTFSGDSPLNYRSFMNIFIAELNCLGNSALTEIEKLLLLKNYLKGEAYDVINEIPITKKNFALSLNILEKMYGPDEGDCINALCDRMKELPPVLTDEIAEIRKTYGKLEAILGSFEEYGELANENRLLQSNYLGKFVNASSLGIEELRGCKLNEIRERVRLHIRAKDSAVCDLIFFKTSSSSNVDPRFISNERKQSGSESSFSDEDIDSASKDPEPSINELSEGYDFHRNTALTTCALVHMVEGGEKVLVRCIIASGFSSMMSENVIDRLGVRSRYEKDVARLNAAGITNVEAQVFIHVPNRSPVKLSIPTVKNICDKTVVTPTVAEFRKDHPHLAGINFPDTGCGLPIEMLIGANSELVSVGFNCGLDNEECPPVNRSRGWSLVSSVFGWIIVGIDTSNEPLPFSLEACKYKQN